MVVEENTSGAMSYQDKYIYAYPIAVTHIILLLLVLILVDPLFLRIILIIAVTASFVLCKKFVCGTEVLLTQTGVYRCHWYEQAFCGVSYQTIRTLRRARPPFVDGFGSTCLTFYNYADQHFLLNESIFDDDLLKDFLTEFKKRCPHVAIDPVYEQFISGEITGSEMRTTKPNELRWTKV